ncbi:MAG: hypothetical protein MZV63_52215 [Marinilabiliales bacterium]|nr:hypothetical protein [Marinilabiliales bacterium]
MSGGKDCRCSRAHGGEEIENVMFDFIRGDYDVLLATTIIESGLDIPNANTIFINDAHSLRALRAASAPRQGWPVE